MLLSTGTDFILMFLNLSVLLQVPIKLGGGVGPGQDTVRAAGLYIVCSPSL
jgi:hypothetical protein